MRSCRQALLMLLLLACGQAPAETAMSFGIVPQQSASKLARLWGPILAHVSAETGLNIRFATAPDIPTFERRLAAGEYDFAYMNPYHYTVFHESPGYQALAKAKEKTIKGILVVRRDSPVTGLDELAGSTLAFPAPAAFAASILTRAHLNALGIAFQADYVSSHDSVYRAVAKGLYPAGGGVRRTFENLSPEIRAQLRVLWTTDGFTPHAIAAHPRVERTRASAVQRALAAMDTTPAGRELVGGLSIPGFESAMDADWDDVRRLDIDLLNDL